MADKTLLIKQLILRNATASAWTSSNPILGSGEMGIEIDTRKFKFGDGITAWNSLKYASGGGVEKKNVAPEPTDADYESGTIWLNTTDNTAYILVSVSGGTATWLQLAVTTGTVENAKTADKLKNARNITLNGAVATNTKSFDGSADLTFTLVLVASGVSAGTYTKVTVNDKGIVTSGENISAADIPNLTLSKITDAGTAAAKDIGTAAGNVPILDSNGKLNASVMPALAITEVFEVNSESEMLALTAQVGDVAIRADENKSYILAAEPASTLDNWKLLRTPTGAVLSVNGKTGAVTLTSDDISEGSTNLYFTNARFDTRFGQKNIGDLADGANAVMTSDTLILDCGNA